MSTYRDYECKHCGKTFKSNKGCKSRTPKYCSFECSGLDARMNKKCKLCGNIIDPHNGSVHNRIYCSRKCMSDSRANIPLSKEWKTALSEGRKKSEKCKGYNLYNWKGGKKTENFRCQISNHNRRSNNNITVDVDFIKALRIAQNNSCFYCNESFTENKNIGIEHLTPTSKGGDNHLYNLVLSCRSCNSKKRSHTLESYSFKTLTDYMGKWEYVFVNAIHIKEKLWKTK